MLTCMYWSWMWSPFICYAAFTTKSRKNPINSDKEPHHVHHGACRPLFWSLQAGVTKEDGADVNTSALCGVRVCLASLGHWMVGTGYIPQKALKV